MQALKSLLVDCRGAVLVEFTLTMLLVLVLTFSVAEFGIVWWQWNSAEKATQLAVRTSVVRDPVALELASFDCATSLTEAGEPCSSPNAASFGTVTCSGATQSCSGGYTFSTATFNELLARVQAVFPLVAAENLAFRYDDIGLGFAGRGAPIPSVTVRLVDMTYSFVAIDFLIGGPFAMPDFRATLTGEDIRTAGA